MAGNQEILRVSPFLTWVLALVTFGLYAFYFLVNRSNTINRIAGIEIIDGKKLLLQILIALSVTLVFWGIFYINFDEVKTNPDMHRAIFWPIALGTLVYLLFIINAFYSLGKSIRFLEKKSSIPHACSPFLAWLLVFVYYFSMPYLQYHINKVIDVKE